LKKQLVTVTNEFLNVTLIPITCCCAQLVTSLSLQTGNWTMLGQLDWYIAPLLNPDGYAYSHHKDGVSEPVSRHLALDISHRTAFTLDDLQRNKLVNDINKYCGSPRKCQRTTSGVEGGGEGG